MSDIVEQMKSLYQTHPICMDAERLRLAAKAVCDHWAEFGPEYGFDETMEGLYRAMARKC